LAPFPSFSLRAWREKAYLPPHPNCRSTTTVSVWQKQKKEESLSRTGISV
jgi:hypothetical protein